MKARLPYVFAPGCLIVVINLLVAWPLFRVEWLAHMGSIEGARIAQARWLLENWPEVAWFPLWYGGLPFQNVYPPLLPAMVALLAAVTGLPVARAFHAVAAIAYCLAPLSLYWAVRCLSDCKRSAFAAGMLFSLVSPSAVLLPVLAADLSSPFGPRRLQNLVVYGEAPHIAGLALVCLALVAVRLAVVHPTIARFALAALAVGAVFVSNWLASAELLLAIGLWLIAGPTVRRPPQWLWAGLILLAGYCLASPLILPSTVFAFVGSEELASAGYASSLWPKALLLALLGAGLVALVELGVRLGWSEACRFFVALTYVTGLACTIGASSDSPAQSHLLRWHLVFDLACCAALALAVQYLMTRLAGLLLSRVLLALGFVGCALLLTKQMAYAKAIIQPVAIDQTVEYQQAQFLASRYPDGRVFVTGSVRFFLNAFVDVPQLGGGFDPALLNPVVSAATYQILTGENAGEREGQVAVLWLKAFGVNAICVPGPRSRQPYRDYKNPRKFEGLLPVVWQDGDDVIYEVRGGSQGHVHVIPSRALPRRRPVHGLDIEPILDYVAAIDHLEKPPALVEWLSPGSARISALVPRGHVLSVQVNYHPAWRATALGKPAECRPDALGQLVIHPDCEGRCEIRLGFGHTPETIFTLLASMAVAALLWLKCLFSFLLHSPHRLRR